MELLSLSRGKEFWPNFAPSACSSRAASLLGFPLTVLCVDFVEHKRQVNRSSLAFRAADVDASPSPLTVSHHPPWPLPSSMGSSPSHLLEANSSRPAGLRESARCFQCGHVSTFSHSRLPVSRPADRQLLLINLQIKHSAD